MNDILTRAYQTLKIPEHASLEQVTGAYYLLVKDKGRTWDEIKEIERAFEVLTDHLSPDAPTLRPEAPGTEKSPLPSENDIFLDAVKGFLFPSVDPPNSFLFGIRVVFFVVILVWGAKFIVQPLAGGSMECSFMHVINLPFHEAGHVVFSFLGDFVRVLGGTAMQILIPLVCMIALLRNRDPFGAVFALWWAGQNFIDVAPYIYDARAGELMLLGGVTGREVPEFHDWHNMLGRLGLLSCDHVIAYLAKYAGVFLMILSFVWGALVLYRQYGSLRRKG